MQIFTRYAIDYLTSRYISGWAYQSFHKTNPIRLHFVSGNRVVGSVDATRYRRDLQLKKLHPTGLCGFDFSFPENINITASKSLDVYINNKKRPFLELPTSHLRSPVDCDMPPILFMHIPKTAGTSFNTFMRMHLPFDRAENHIEKFNRGMYAILGRQKKYLAGHLTVKELKKYFSLGNFDCYSLVRSPYSHLHSHLNWLKGIAADQKSPFFKQHNKPAQQLALKVDRIDFDCLEQIKEFVFGLEGFELDFFDNCQTRYFLNYRPNKVSRNDFTHTLANIELFKHIGITEKYDKFRDFVSSSYGLPAVTLPERQNQTICPILYDIESTDIQEVLYPLVQTDILLYNHITKQHAAC